MKTRIKELRARYDLTQEEFAKRGKLGGKKQVCRCPQCFTYKVSPWSGSAPLCPDCGGSMDPLLKMMIDKGEIVENLPTAKEVRDKVMKQLEIIKRMEDRE